MSQQIQVLIIEDNPGDTELLLQELRRAKFDPPGANGSTISVPFNFVKQGS